MRIPEDIIYRFVGKPRQQQPTDERTAEPVDNLTPGKDVLSQPRARQDQTPDGNSHGRDVAQEQKPGRQPGQSPESQGERRRQDRRQKQVNVLLDTRINPPRRREAEHPSIDVKI